MTGRLIDAGEFRRHIDSHYPFNQAEQSRHGIADVAKSSLLLVLSKEPTVDAIPISFIKELIDLSRKVGADHHAESLEILLADWAERKQG